MWTTQVRLTGAVVCLLSVPPDGYSELASGYTAQIWAAVEGSGNLYCPAAGT